ncbi:MAG: acyl carrier protein [Verrucomicrobiales bacterium]|jgi:acyl carrier protein
MPDITPEKVVEDLKKILVDELYVDIDPATIKESDSLINGIGLDSVGLMELVALVEEKYSITIEETSDVPPEQRTLRTFADYCITRMA